MFRGGLPQPAFMSTTLILVVSHSNTSQGQPCFACNKIGLPWVERNISVFFSPWAGITDLMVNQTPEYVNQGEGTNITIVCRFRTVSNYNSTVVRWYRDEKELNSAADSLRIKLDAEGGVTSFTLTNAAERDSGNYTCRVEVRSRNLTGSGKVSRIAIVKGKCCPHSNQFLGEDHRKG